jgi:hypothetical protein
MFEARALKGEPDVPFGSVEEATRYLEDLSQRMGVRHFSYWLLTYVDGTPDDVVWIATYDPAYMSFYMSTFTPLGDPGFEAATGHGKLIDWTAWHKTDRTSQELYETARKFGIGKYGVSLPYKDPDAGDVLFSINVESDDEHWPEHLREIIAIYRPFVVQFHGRVKPMITARRGDRQG